MADSSLHQASSQPATCRLSNQLGAGGGKFEKVALLPNAPMKALFQP